MRRYVAWLQGLDEEDREPISSRYVGSLIADVHRTLLQGGVFLYPADSSQPSGKLRLVYEAQPLAFITQHAGGYASEGTRSILDIQPTALHQRTPLFLGSRELVEKAEWFLRTYDRDSQVRPV
jgi:fructose-1,6-bisphosphatase I